MNQVDAALFLMSKDKFSLLECEALAKDLGAYDKLEFDLVGPLARKRAQWVDAYYGIFSLEGSNGHFHTRQFQYAGDLHCENLSLPETANVRS